MSVASQQMLSAANRGEMHFFGAEQGTASVNSHLRWVSQILSLKRPKAGSRPSLDWSSCRFGLSVDSKFFAAGCSERYIRFYWANEGRESSEVPNARKVDVSFGIHQSVKAQLEAHIRDDLRRMRAASTFKTPGGL